MDIIKIIDSIVDKIFEKRDELSELDRAIGDSDHGVNLSRGFQKIKEESSIFSKLNYSEIANKMAMILISNVGGASGAIYGTGLMRVAQSLKGVEELDRDKVGVALGAMVEGIKFRGKAIAGEKTMLDTLEPVEKIFQESKELSICEFLDKIEEVAQEGMESTKDMLATKGRASYLGERSIGHIDPGAMSSYIIVKTICENLREEFKC